MNYFINKLLFIASWLFVVATPVVHAQDELLDTVTVPYTITNADGSKTEGTLTFEKNGEQQIRIPIQDTQLNEDTNSISVELGTPSGGVTLSGDDKKTIVTLLRKKIETPPAASGPRLGIDKQIVDSGGEFKVTPQGFSSDLSFTWSASCGDGGLSALSFNTSYGSLQGEASSFGAPIHHEDSNVICTITLTGKSKFNVLDSLLNFVGQKEASEDETASATITIKPVPELAIIATPTTNTNGVKVYTLKTENLLTLSSLSKRGYGREGTNRYNWKSECPSDLENGQFGLGPNNQGADIQGNAGAWFPPEETTGQDQQCTLSVTYYPGIYVGAGPEGELRQTATIKVTVPIKIPSTVKEETTPAAATLPKKEYTFNFSGSDAPEDLIAKMALDDAWSVTIENFPQAQGGSTPSSLLPQLVTYEGGKLMFKPAGMIAMNEWVSEKPEIRGAKYNVSVGPPGSITFNYKATNSDTNETVSGKIIAIVGTSEKTEEKKVETMPAKTTVPSLEVETDTVESGDSFEVTYKGFSEGLTFTTKAECGDGLEISKAIGLSTIEQEPNPGTWNVSYHQSDSAKECTITYTGESGKSSLFSSAFSAVTVLFSSDDKKDIKETASITVKVKPIPELKINVTPNKDANDEEFYVLLIENTKGGPSTSNTWKKECPSGLDSGRFGITSSGTDGNYQQWYPPVNTTSSAVECTISVDHSPGSSIAMSAISTGKTYDRPSQSASVTIKVEPIIPLIGGLITANPEVITTEEKLNVTTSGWQGGTDKGFSYSWSDSCNGSFSGSDKDVLWTPPATISGQSSSCTLSVKVTDKGNQAFGTASKEVTVNKAPDAPRLIVDPPSGAHGTRITATAKGFKSKTPIKINAKCDGGVGFESNGYIAAGVSGGLTIGEQIYTTKTLSNPWIAPVNVTGSDISCTITAKGSDTVKEKFFHIKPLPLPVITATPNPVESGKEVELKVTNLLTENDQSFNVTDPACTVVCPDGFEFNELYCKELTSDSTNNKTTTWTVPVNETGSAQACTIGYRVTYKYENGDRVSGGKTKEVSTKVTIEPKVWVLKLDSQYGGAMYEYTKQPQTYFTLTLDSPAPEGGIEVDYTISGDDIKDNDFKQPLEGKVTIPAGKTSAKLDLQPNDDDEPESDSEPFTVTLTIPEGVKLAEGSQLSTEGEIIRGFEAVPSSDISFGKEIQRIELDEGDEGETTNFEFEIFADPPINIGNVTIKYEIEKSEKTELATETSGTISFTGDKYWR